MSGTNYSTAMSPHQKYIHYIPCSFLDHQSISLDYTTGFRDQSHENFIQYSILLLDTLLLFEQSNFLFLRIAPPRGTLFSLENDTFSS